MMCLKIQRPPCTATSKSKTTKESSFQTTAISSPNDYTNGTNMTSESDTSEQLSATDKQIIDSVPKMMKTWEKLLIQKLKDHYDIISWNDNRQLVLEGSIIPNSNIVDSVNDVMRNRKGFNPDHSNTFAKALTKINVP